MKRMEIGMLQWLKTRICTEWVILAMVLSVLSGCATDGTVEPEPVVQRIAHSREVAWILVWTIPPDSLHRKW